MWTQKFEAHSCAQLPWRASGKKVCWVRPEKLREKTKENGKTEMDYAKKNGQKGNLSWVSEAKKEQAGWKRKRER